MNTPPVRESQARLLGDSRSSEPRARLAQAASRADFLVRVSRRLSAIQRPDRALEALVPLLVSDLVDVVSVTVRQGPWEMVCGAVAGGPAPTCDSIRRTSRQEDDLSRVMAGDPFQSFVPAPRDSRGTTLADWLRSEDLADRARRVGVETLVGLPLAARGRVLGVMFLGRGRSGGFAGAESFLRDLADRIALGLDSLLLVAESRHVAEVLRRSLAPEDLPVVAGLDIASSLRVAHQAEAVGGDFVDGAADERGATFLIGDVAGKGVEAAVLGKRIRNAVRTLGLIERAPGWILEMTNRVLVSEAGLRGVESFATAACVRITATGDGRAVAEVALAGHPSPLLVRAAGVVESVGKAGVALALIPDSSYDVVTVTMDPDDLLVLYTDGVTEAPGALDRFGEERLQRLLARFHGAPAGAATSAVAMAVGDHLDSRPYDDVALLVIGVPR